MTNTEFDGGGFPMFKSFHDYRLPAKLVGPLQSNNIQFRNAFEDLKKTLATDPNWRKRFTPLQVQAISQAIATNDPRIKGFIWHHHQDHGVLQLVLAKDHSSTHHHGGRFTTGGYKK